ncbi:MAG: patatin-like phospholipase family protein [Elusimicrobia bacterium]|nr:patatin-like phospholipase family protein [Elusimicrobiota bacterium]
MKSIKTLIFFFLFQQLLFSYEIEDFLEILANSSWQDLKPKTGLVLSGGAARGVAHIGVLEAFDEENFKVDVIGGVSVGAIVGALYASGKSALDISKIGEFLTWKNLIEVKVTPTRLLNLSGIISNERMSSFLKSYIGDKTFSDLKITFVCIACDLRTGEEIVFDSGKLIPAVRASSAVPGLFEPVSFSHRILVDGGVVDNVPVETVRRKGAQFVIVSWTGGGEVFKEQGDIISILTQVIAISGKLIASEKLEKADFVISPDLSDIKPTDLDRFDEIRERGYFAAKENYKKLRKEFLKRVLLNFSQKNEKK